MNRLCIDLTLSLTCTPGDYGELALKEGDMVIVLGDENNGHYLAEVGGKKGLVPTNYVEEYSAKRPVSEEHFGNLKLQICLYYIIATLHRTLKQNV